MRTVTPTDMRKRLGEILDAASAGERILIERDHKPLAILVPVEDGERLDEGAEELKRRRLAALERLDELAKRIAAEYPSQPGDPDAATLVRRDRDSNWGRDDDR